ncbi:response regulator transcription factor [Acidicapsa acidisoli]|uniref:response regulator transcription factor n=1 Tax=Acidicapsa acidisoli TaxID=1615681 RepID=UPI0021E0C1F9|nr:response regulator transcription factor [Acidicapsa acidisoli]
MSDSQRATTVEYRAPHRRRRRNVERILVIYDDPGSPQTVRRILEGAGYEVSIAAFDPIAMDDLCATEPELIVLDVCLPGKTTQNLCRQIREKSQHVSILVLSAISDVEEVVLLLKIGADDYMTKPFSALEFLARIRAAMRRHGNY